MSKYYYNSDGYLVCMEQYKQDEVTGEDIVSRVLYDESGEAHGVEVSTLTESGNSTGMVYLYRKNIFGDITGVISPEGQLLMEYTYDAYGNVSYKTDGQSLEQIIAGIFATLFIPQLYKGYIYTTVGDKPLYYLGSRFYLPELGRFLNADKHVDTNTNAVGTNMYTYCNNNPIMFSDPSGESPFAIIISIISLFTAIITILTGCNNGNNKLQPTPPQTTQDRYTEIYNSISDEAINDKGKFKKMSEADILARVIYAENTFSKDGQCAVALCIKNRKAQNSTEFYDSSYGNNYRGVCLKPYAFEPVDNFVKNLREPSGDMWKHAKELATKLVLNRSINIPNGYSNQLFFVSASYFDSNTRYNKTEYHMGSVWVKIKDVANIGNNVFFNYIK